MDDGSGACAQTKQEHNTMGDGGGSEEGVLKRLDSQSAGFEFAWLGSNSAGFDVAWLDSKSVAFEFVWLIRKLDGFESLG